MGTPAGTLFESANADRQIRLVQWLTIAWMTVEVAISAAAAVKAHSIALLGFGGDSVVELMSAALVLRRFHSPADEQLERRTARLAAILLFALAAFIVIMSAAALTGRFRAQPSWPGIALLVAAAVIMPWLARQKRRLATATASRTLRADAVQSSVCAYMAWIALTGLLLNAVAGIGWADPLAALALTPLIIKEAREAMRGDVCGCCP